MSDETFLAVLEAAVCLSDQLAAMAKDRDKALAEVEHMRRGIEAYRYVHKCCNPAEWSKHHDWPVPCKSCEWEREDKKRKESGDE